MNKKRIEIEVTEYSDLNELDIEEQALIREAISGISGSYAPYSHFHVAATVQLMNGTLLTGTNQENAAYPSGICAERTALFFANSNYPDQSIIRMAIAASTPQGLTQEPISPCGACRQVLLESENRYGQPICLLLYGTKKIYKITQTRDLLPFAFHSDHLK